LLRRSAPRNDNGLEELALPRSTIGREKACKPDSVSAKAEDGHSSDATYPPCPGGFTPNRAGRSLGRAYLVLLRGEIARFTLRLCSGQACPPLQPKTRLCGSNPPLARDGCYPFRCPMESGLSSPRLKDAGRPSGLLSKTLLYHPNRVG